jgi:dUTP pyrophosphatase
MRCYLATPIDFAGGMNAGFRTKIRTMLTDAGHTVYDPSAGWHVGSGSVNETDARAIEGTNRQALRRSDVVVAWLPEGVVSHGVPAEIEFATRNQGIPAIVVGKAGVSLMSNPLVSILPEERLGLLARWIDLAVDKFDRSTEYRIRYSAPKDVTLEHAHPGDAGVDLRASEDVLINPGEQMFVPSGVKIALPSGTFGWIVARSSTFGNHGLLVLPGIIDEQYQGELGISCVNLTKLPHRVRAGERLGQMLLLANFWRGFELDRVDEENVFPFPTSRGTGGFGSSGR